VLVLSAPAPAGFDSAVVVEGVLLLSILICGVWRSIWYPARDGFDRRTIFLYSALLGYPVLRAAFDALAETGSASELIRHVVPLTVPGVCFLPWLFTSRRGSLSHLMIWSAVPGLLQIGVIFWVQIFLAPASDGAQAAIERITLGDARTTQTAIVFLFGLLATYAVIPAATSLRFSAAVGCTVALVICMATLMRSMLLILGCQLVVAVLCSFRFYGVWNSLRRLALPLALAVLTALLVLAAVPRFHASIDALVERIGATDFGEGRLEGEWDIALSQFSSAAGESPSIAMLGFGPRFSFESSSGDQRSYLHNIELFWLIFYGFSAAAIGCGVLWSVSTRVIYKCKSGTLASCYVACCWFGLIAYAQTFAVQKLVLFNVQFAILVIVAAHQPASASGCAPQGAARDSRQWNASVRRSTSSRATTRRASARGPSSATTTAATRAA
jgi:hypothetical protein